MTQRPYRARDIKTNELVYGGHFEHKGKEYIIPASIRILPLGYMEGPPSMDGFIEVHPASVSQSTGVKDKHGVEIYGGMSVLWREIECVVEWYHECWTLRPASKKGPLFFFHDLYCPGSGTSDLETIPEGEQT